MAIGKTLSEDAGMSESVPKKASEDEAQTAGAPQPRSDHDADINEALDDEELYAQGELPRQDFDEEGLRRHLCPYKMRNESTRKVLGLPSKIEEDPASEGVNEPLIPQGDSISKDISKEDERCHCKVVDVGADGRAAGFESRQLPDGVLRSQPILDALRKTPSSVKSAVGRMVVAQDFGPSLSRALHFVTRGTFDIDTIFCKLVNPIRSSRLEHHAYLPWEQMTRRFGMHPYTTLLSIRTRRFGTGKNARRLIASSLASSG